VKQELSDYRLIMRKLSRSELMQKATAGSKLMGIISSKQIFILGLW
jgi:hypothetical protein